MIGKAVVSRQGLPNNMMVPPPSVNSLTQAHAVASRAYLALLRFAQSCWRQESSQPSLAPLSLGTPPRAAPPRVTGGDGDSEMSEAPGGQQVGSTLYMSAPVNVNTR
jgi:hypothetical protein